MSGVLYTASKNALGVVERETPIAVFEDGKVYSARAGFDGMAVKNKLIGEYENGKIYDVSGFRRINCVGEYDGEKIYRVSQNALGGVTRSLSVASYYNGKIYSDNSRRLEYSDLLGAYIGDDDGAAAAAALVVLKFKSDVSASRVVQNASGGAGGNGGNGSSASKGAGAGMGCIGWILSIGFLPLLAIGVVAVLAWQYCVSHPLMASLIVSALVATAASLIGHSKKGALAGILAFIITMTGIFCITDMNHLYNDRTYMVYLNGVHNQRAMTIYKNWKFDIYVFDSAISEFCEGISVSNVELVDGEGTFVDYSVADKVPKALITLYNANNNTYKTFEGYSRHSNYVPLKEVAEWVGRPCSIRPMGLNFEIN